MSEQEEDRKAPETDDPDVEGHRRAFGDEGAAAQEAERRAKDDEPDVEGHRRA
jgi:hypothetical protein